MSEQKQKITEMEINGETYVLKNSIENKAKEIDGLIPVIVRSYAAGIHFGLLKSSEYTSAGEVVTLLDTQRIWSWVGACSISQIAIDGIEKGNISVLVPKNKIVNVIETIELTEKSFMNLKNQPIWKK